MNIEDAITMTNQELNNKKYFLISEESPIKTIVASASFNTLLFMGYFAITPGNIVQMMELNPDLSATIVCGAGIITGSLVGLAIHNINTSKDTKKDYRKYKLLRKYSKQLQKGNNVFINVLNKEGAIDDFLESQINQKNLSGKCN